MGPRGRAGRRRGLVVGAAVGSSITRKNAQAKEPATPAETNSNEQFAELEKLGQLKAEGVLTQEEFDAKKKQILGL